QVAGDAPADIGLDVARQAEPDIGKQQADTAQNRQDQGEPDALAPGQAGLAQAAGAEVLGDDRDQGVHHAHQADEDGDVDRGAQRDRLEVGGAGVAHHGRVQDGEDDTGPGTDQDRPGLPQDGAPGG